MFHFRWLLLSSTALCAPPEKPGAGGDDFDLELEDGNGEENENGAQEGESEEDGDEGEGAEEGQSDADEDEGSDVLNDRRSGEEGDDLDARDEERRSPRRSRAADRIQASRDQVRAERERSERLERELNELRQERQRDRQRQDQLDEQDRIALMTPEERMQHEMQKTLADLRQQNQLQEFRNADERDRIAYQMEASRDPRFKKYEAEVEQQLMVARRDLKMNYPRKTVLAFILGNKILEREANAAKKTSTPNKRRVSTPPSNGRNDTGSRRRREQSLEERLADKAI